ncbi:hypothetical protein PspLS_11265 [Pyricularia sp. CBS 133598]|nr:hypothetical protein PspLS_11265 [Pyricularia sp. CBS 133598]
MKASLIFMFAVSLTLGAAAQVASNEVAAELTARDTGDFYLDKRTMKLMRRKSRSSSGGSSSIFGKKGSSSDKTGNICSVNGKFGNCQFDMRCSSDPNGDIDFVNCV